MARFIYFLTFNNSQSYDIRVLIILNKKKPIILYVADIQRCNIAEMNV